MATTLIIACSRCAGLLLAKADTKTRICPYCGAKIETKKAKPLASAKNANEASEILRQMKSDASAKRGSISAQSRL